MGVDARKEMATGVRALNPIQRRVLAALADGAQVLKAPGDLGFYAYAENAETGRVVRVTPPLARADLKVMCTFLPEIQLERNVEGDYEFYYLPGAVRQEVKELLTRSMPAPDMVKTQAQWKRSHSPQDAGHNEPDDDQKNDSVLRWAHTAQP